MMRIQALSPVVIGAFLESIKTSYVLQEQEKEASTDDLKTFQGRIFVFC